jgi:hypothetical protein
MPLGYISKRQEGVVLIIVALLALGLITMVGLILDIYTLRITKSSQDSSTAVAASNSISTYARTTGAPAERLEAAREAAEKTANVNFSFSMGKALAVDPTATIDVGNGLAPTAPERRNPLSPGIWHFLPTWQLPYFDPITHLCLKSACPCKDNKWNGPCFEGIDINDPSTAGTEIDSMNLSVTLEDETALKTVFMRTVGIESQAISATSTAALRPLRIVFLVDLSRPSVWETHLPYEAIGPGSLPNYVPAEYAYHLMNKSCAASDSPYLVFRGEPGFDSSLLTCQPKATYDVCSGVNTANWPPSDCEFAGGWIPGFNNAEFNQYCPKPFLVASRVIPSHPHLLHAKEEYRCFPTTYQEGSDTAVNAAYLVDAYRGDTKDQKPYTGPEPLNTMLAAVKAGLDIIAQRELHDDRVAIVGFDRRADMNIRRFDLTAYDSSDFPSMQHLVQTPEDPTFRNSQHLFFPREDAVANIPDAIKKAADMLMALPDYPATENHVILITDGLSICSPTDEYRTAYDCSFNTDSAKKSIDDAVKLVNELYVPNSLHLDVLLIGGLVQPHQVMRKGPQGTCMDQSLTEDASLPFTAGDSTDPKELEDAIASGTVTNGALTFANKYLYPNKLASAVSASDGIWGPVRQPCVPPVGVPLPDGKTCAAGGLLAHLDERCAALMSTHDTLGLENGITDADGRLICDPQCRDREEQVEDYIKTILNKSKTVTLGNILVE